MALYNHVQIKVRDLKVSCAFYDSVMEALGYKRVLEVDNVVIGYGSSVHDMFEIRQFDDNHRSPLSKHVHVAFNAPSQQIVDAFYSAAMGKGAKCNGKPGFRPHYENGYYAAFIIDPDGHNIEAVYSINA